MRHFANMIRRYGALQHNTQPTIRTSELGTQVFAPLGEAEPQLQNLIDLITINGYVIERSNQSSGLSDNEINELEAKIGALRLARSAPPQPPCRSFRTAYEPIARIHMLW